MLLDQFFCKSWILKNNTFIRAFSLIKDPLPLVTFLNPEFKLSIAYGVTDFRKQIHSLCDIVQSKYKLNPYKKEAFIFCNKKRNSIRV